MSRASMLSLVGGPRLGNEVTASVLANHESFLIGAVEVVPATKTVRRDGRETVIEPRVMQVLVALADAGGAVVSRDQLVTTCWDGRIVGDDAINRIMSRLRRLAHDVGHDSFAIETVTKVGYRLRLADDAAASSDAPAKESRIDRRALIGALAVIPLALGGTWWWSRGDRKYNPPPQAEVMFDQAMLAFNQNTREGQSQAVGILRKLVQDYPNYADAWGGLGMTYAVVSHFRTQAESAVLQQRASSAGRRALLLDPDNGFGVLALAGARPNLGNWLRSERALRAALARDPDNVPILSGLNYMMMSVGRIDAALGFNQRMEKLIMPSPGQLFSRIMVLWYAGRLDETDLAIARASELYPTHFAIWFARFYVALYSGRAETAVALAADRSQHPSGIPSEEIQSIERVARAFLAPSAASTSAVIEEWVQQAKLGSGHAENAIQFAAALGRLDVALNLLRAYYFGENFVVPEVRFTLVQGTYTPFNDRQTAFLFAPSLVSLRGRPAFGSILRRLGLERYWQEVGVKPDFRLS